MQSFVPFDENDDKLGASWLTWVADALVGAVRRGHKNLNYVTFTNYNDFSYHVSRVSISLASFSRLNQ